MAVWAKPILRLHIGPFRLDLREGELRSLVASDTKECVDMRP